MHTYARRCAVLAAAALALGAAAAPAGAAGRTTVPGSVPKWAQPSRDRGAAPDAKQVTVTVYLPLRNAPAGQRAARPVTDPSSADYGKFLSSRTPSASASPPATPTSPRVEGFLRGAGLTVTDVPTNNHHVEATGDARAGRGRLRHERPPLRLQAAGCSTRPTTALSVPSRSTTRSSRWPGSTSRASFTRPQNDLPGATSDVTQGAQPGAGGGARP